MENPELLNGFVQDDSNDIVFGETKNDSTDYGEIRQTTAKRIKKRVIHLSDSDEGCDKENSCNSDNLTPTKIDYHSEKENSENERIIKPDVRKSRIRTISSNDDTSDSDTSQKEKPTKYLQQQLRMTNKKNKLKEKFLGLITSRDEDRQVEKCVASHNESSESSNEETFSIENIKQKINERSLSYKVTICDPDTSAEESSEENKPLPQKKKKNQMKTMKLTSPKPVKPVRMTAKQAMENMKKIKSESNRMLREREVSLPYHKPKALSLKDILSRRKPAVSSDGKTLPIKMNEEQLRQYAQLLEERQKEMMELCKSDTEEEESEQVPKLDMLEETECHSKIATETDVPVLNLEKDKNIIIEETENNCLTETDMLFSNLENCKNAEGKFDSLDVSCAHSLNISDEKVKSINTTDISNEKMEDNSNTDIKLVYNESEEQVSELKHINNYCETKMLNEKNIETTEHKTNNCETEILDGLNIETTEHNANNCETEILNEKNIETTEHKTNNCETEILNEKNIETPEHKTNNCETEILNKNNIDTEQIQEKVDSEIDSQLVSLHYESEKNNHDLHVQESNLENKVAAEKDVIDFSDNEIDMAEIDNMIENAEILNSQDLNEYNNVHSPMLIKEIQLNIKPKLTGAPGTVIDLDGTYPVVAKKLSGVELLKERFTYFSKLKTPEELEREKEKRMKPGAQHLRLRQELEEKIAEQRSLEWAKRLEEEKQQQQEMNIIRGESSDDDIDKIEAKLEENHENLNAESSGTEEDEEEEDICLGDEKPRERNPLIDDEAEESEVEEECEYVQKKIEDDDDGKYVNDPVVNDDHEADDEDDDDDSDTSSDEEMLESKADITNKPKKGRILKAFEDSDDEIAEDILENKNILIGSNDPSDQIVDNEQVTCKSNGQTQKGSQDDDIQLAQMHKSFSDDLFTSQENDLIGTSNNKCDNTEEIDIGTQTFSIINNETKLIMELEDAEKLNFAPETQHNDDLTLGAVVPMCSGSFSQNLVTSQCLSTPSQSLPIGEDILNLCTGKFYDSKFVSQLNSNDINNDVPDTLSIVGIPSNTKEHKKPEDGNLLNSILDELNDPEFEKPKTNKYFIGNSQNYENEQANTQLKKKFIIDSDDENYKDNKASELKAKKKLKKKRLEKRALKISDDEEDEDDETEDDISDIEGDPERIVEYDSEENEIEVKPQNLIKKRKMTEFFEQEAELTSEDEWVGSGDEDEAGLDRMEREEGDDDTFNQTKLQRELGQIHMRDVLDQDKREVRLIQELLFEDGDLGAGHRQRKFRWRNADGEEETGTLLNAFADTQEEEFESEEQWRKQRHEREVFLRQMQKQDEDDSVNVSINRTTIIKANLNSRSISSLVSEGNKTTNEKIENITVVEKKSAIDIPSPKKAFTVFQQNYHGSLLSRGRGALARLAALAIPLAVDEDTPKVGTLGPSSKRNFVFAALTPESSEPKVTKRKADPNIGTPKLVKKLKMEEKHKHSRNSLLDHLKV